MQDELLEQCLQKAAQAWCQENTSDRVMDEELAKNFAKILYDELKEERKLRGLFRLQPSQNIKLNEWLKEQDKIAVEKQKSQIDESSPGYVAYKSCWESGYPYTGAIGGDLTYSFTLTSLGMVATVKYGLTGETIDLTDYDNW